MRRGCFTKIGVLCCLSIWCVGGVTLGDRTRSAASKAGVRYRIEAPAGIPEATFVTAEGLNNRGQVLLQVYFNDRIHLGYVWSVQGAIRIASPEGGDTWPHDINERGQVVGSFERPDGRSRAFLWEQGKMIGLGVLPGDDTSVAWSLNNRGQVVGISETAQKERHGFLWSRENGMQRLVTSEGKDFLPTAINDRGQMTGSVGSNACFWEQGRWTELGTLPEMIGSAGLGINERGEVVGVSGRGGGRDRESRVFFYRQGRMTELTTLGGKTNSAFGINASGQVVGQSFQTTRGQRAFLLTEGKAEDLNDLLPPDSGWQVHFARAINDRGQIVGSGTLNGKSRPFLMTPLTTKSRPDR